MAAFTITHRGVPIGSVQLEPTDERSAVAVEPFPGYEGIRAIIRAASAALRATTGGASDQEPAARSALHEGAMLGRDLELRDHVGELVPTDFIELGEWPGEDPEVRAWIGFRGVPAARTARRVPPKKSGPESAPPAA